MSDATELERLRAEAAALRALVRTLSARQAAVVAELPVNAVLALALGTDPEAGPPFSLGNWHETIEMSSSDVRTELELLWQRLPPRESA